MIEERVSLRQLRVFGLGAGAILVGLPALATILHPGGRPSRLVVVPFALGALLVLLGGFFPAGLAPVYRKWIAVARAISRFNTLVILTASYCLLIAPLGLLLRLFKGDPMERRMEPGSYWRKPRRHSLGDRHFERQF